jgi:hypothetical protein
LALLQLAKGISAPRIARVIPLTAQAIRNVGRRYQQGGLDRALYDKQRPGAAEVLGDSQKQRLIAMVCSSPATSTEFRAFPHRGGGGLQVAGPDTVTINPTRSAHAAFAAEPD